jgi:hypothetical protein
MVLSGTRLKVTAPKINPNLESAYIFLHYIIHNISHTFSLIIFSFSKDQAIFNFHKRMQLWNGNKIDLWWTKTPKLVLQPRMQDFTKIFTNYSNFFESIWKYKMLMFMLMLNSFQNSCKKNNKNVIKQPPKKNLLNLFILNEKTKTMKKKINGKTFFFPRFQLQGNSSTCIT